MNELVRLQGELEALQTASEESPAHGTDLMRTGTPEALRAQMEDAQERTRRQGVLVRAKVAEIQAYVAQQKEDLAQAARNAELAMRPVQEALREIGEQLKTMDLYLGTGERIVQIRDGRAAPEDTTITIRQLVLRMDEEAAAAQSEEDLDEGGWDFHDIRKFDQWLLSDPAHLEQVIPEPKGVVCLTPRDPSQTKQTEHVSQLQAEAAANAAMYWLIRNGDKLYRTTTDFAVEGKLVPGPDTFTGLFTDRHGKTIRPGTYDWEKAQDAVNLAELDYYRVQVILEGLLHRTPVFEPLPLQGMSFVDRDHHKAGRLQFVLDAEASLGDGHEPFRAWQKRLGAQLRPGLRIIGSFYSYGGFGSHGSSYDRDGNSRLYPRHASTPEDGEIYELTLVQGGKLGFTYTRTDKIYDRKDRWGQYLPAGPAKTRASCRIRPDDEWIIPYDLADEADLRRFLTARTDRANYVNMFPLIRAALKAKRAERKLEEPFRIMLAGVLARENGVTVAEAEAAMPALVKWFKTTNKWHRPILIAQPDKVKTVNSRSGRTEREVNRETRQPLAHEKAVRLITAEHARQVRAMGRAVDWPLVEELKDLLPTASVMVGRRRSDGRYVSIVPERSTENVYAKIIVWNARKGWQEMRHWQILTSAMVARWEVLWNHERWDEWEVNADPRKHLTDPEGERLAKELMTAIPTATGLKDSDRGPILGITAEERYSHPDIIAWMVTEMPVLADPEHPLTGEQGASGSVEGRGLTWHRDKEGRARFAPRRAYTTGWTHIGARWVNDWRSGSNQDADLTGPPWPKDARVLYKDTELLRTLRPLFQARARAEVERSVLTQRRWEFKASIDRAWKAAWWEQQREAFIQDYRKPELWQGQRKVIEEDRRRRGRELIMPSAGLEELLSPYIERGEDEQIWGMTVGALLARLGIGFPAYLEVGAKLDPSLLPLKFERKQEPQEEAWEEDEVDFDAEATVQVAGELEAGDIMDAEVVE